MPPEEQVTTLFRPEVASRERSKLHGDIHVFNSTRWSTIFYAVVAIFALLAAIVAAVPFPRVIAVRALVSPDRGIAPVTATRSGVIRHIGTQQGETVEKGTVIARIDVGERLGNGTRSTSVVAAALAKQLVDTEGRLLALGEQVRIDTLRLDQAEARSKLQLSELSQQIKLQEQLIALARSALDRAEALSAKGYVTRIYLDDLRESLLAKRQRLSELTLAREVKQQESAQVALERRSTWLSAQKDGAVLRIEREELFQRLSNNTLAEGYSVTAPISGTIGNIRLRPGQSVEAGAAIADVVPQSGNLIVELQAPPSSIASVTLGQEVMVSLDAMPSQNFGTLKARVARISSTTTVRQGVAPYYTVTAVIDRARTNPAILKVLRPDLTGNASVVLDRGTILNWLLVPFTQR